VYLHSFSKTAKEVLKRRWQRRHLVMIFTASHPVGVNLKVIFLKPVGRIARTSWLAKHDLLQFQSFILSEDEINIPARCHTYLECSQPVANAPNISQSYFCVVRATHNSNDFA